jgi:VanZ family protein
MKETRTRFALWTAVVLWMAFIFTLSAQPATESSELSGGLIRTIAGIVTPGFNSMDAAAQGALIESFQHIARKTAHMLAYMVLGILSMAAFLRYPLKMTTRSVSSLSLCVVYAISDELHQLLIDGRSGQISDVLIDSAGALIGIGIVWLAFSVRKRRKNRSG